MSQTASQPSQDVSHTTKPSSHRHTVRLVGQPVGQCVKSSCQKAANPANAVQWQTLSRAAPCLASLRGLHIPESIQNTRETIVCSGNLSSLLCHTLPYATLPYFLPVLAGQNIRLQKNKTWYTSVGCFDWLEPSGPASKTYKSPHPALHGTS